jgi:putative membrane protein
MGWVNLGKWASLGKWLADWERRSGRGVASLHYYCFSEAPMRHVFFALTMVVASAAYADTVPAPTKEFVPKVAVANKFEIDTSQLALKYGKAPEVKTFAQTMIDDHTKAGEDFKAALAEAKIDPPADSLDIAHTAKYAKLRVFTTESGFDSSYIDAQLEAHQEAVALFKDYVANGPAGPVKTFAEKTLPTLEHHLMMVQELRGKIPKP